MDDSTPLYRKIKDHIVERIDSGTWIVDQRVPSENNLVGQFGASRMTVNRALRELTAEGRLRRVQGLGTFVADPRPQAPLLEILNIADEIAARGHRHRCEVHKVGAEPANQVQADQMGIRPGGILFVSLIVHFENDRPIQVEDRLVNPAVAPDYLDIDFTRTTPNEYLMAAAPLANFEHVVDAILPDPKIAGLLDIPETEPCLLLHRRTWSGGHVASRAWLTHPSSRYRLGASFVSAGPDGDPFEQGQAKSP